jgi:hypothetical protein
LGFLNVDVTTGKTIFIAQLDTVRAELERVYGERIHHCTEGRGVVADLKAHVECLKLLLDCLPTTRNTAMLEELRLSYKQSRTPPNNTDDQVIEQRLFEVQQELRNFSARSAAHAEYLEALRAHRGAADNSIHCSEELGGLAERWVHSCEERVALTGQLQGCSFKISLRYCTHISG